MLREMSRFRKARLFKEITLLPVAEESITILKYLRLKMVQKFLVIMKKEFPTAVVELFLIMVEHS